VESERVFCQWNYFRLRSKIFFWPSRGGGGDRPHRPHGSATGQITNGVSLAAANQVVTLTRVTSELGRVTGTTCCRSVQFSSRGENKPLPSRAGGGAYVRGGASVRSRSGLRGGVVARVRRHATRLTSYLFPRPANQPASDAAPRPPAVPCRP